MNHAFWTLRKLPVILTGIALLAIAMQARAVPSFARQTGLACNACHTVAPQLNAFGRFFKLHGYVMGTNKLTGGSSQLSISELPPISAMAIVSDTLTRQAQPDSQNGTVQFPQQLSVFYAGAISEHAGAFAQLTYEQPTDHFVMDNTDVRYARDVNWDGQSLLWGLTLNNNPTVQDVWNSTPAWGFPFISSAVAPTPMTSPLIAGPLAQNVAGVGAYAWLNNSWYGELTFYRSSQGSASVPYTSASTAVISGLSPYWRFAWEHPWASGDGQSDFEIGTLGINTHLYPGAGHPLSGPTDDYLDVGADAQYQYITSNNSLAVHAIYIHERQDLSASSLYGLAANPSNHLNSWNVNASYYWGEAYGPTLGYFSISGSADPVLYAPAALSGSATGFPDSRGWILQWTWVPTLNVQASLQYVWYNRFNGASTNYDGAGRSASDNNTLYLALWLLW
ncbi:MAG: cytochrome C [Gammaproteobacteria bacterium]|nr:cytochrome C [Gammaproteobacteria bacterium]MBU6509694.1 cytochrome C [Gammaproteobacteria bacterium]MDE1983388.1 cytochrome C [Gammaproteobacteria bacterium]MDE2108938.1 cytochrome C [Gammaproteobacteria bacterium]MDE2460610.1 cytochrome C [Gammaproteobacteria bacterium]